MKKMGIILIAILILVGCQSGPDKRTTIGAGAGAAIGAGLGAIIGHQSGNKHKGALVGATFGGLLGGGIGYHLDKQAKELAQIAETKRTEKGIITKLKGDILFDSGRAELKANATLKIDQIAQILVKYPEDRVKVVGHTDSQGSDEFNANLSRKRAQAVFSRLLKNGVPSQALQVKGMGEIQPIASNATIQGRSLNRRVELEISIDEEAFKKRN